MMYDSQVGEHHLVNSMVCWLICNELDGANLPTNRTGPHIAEFQGRMVMFKEQKDLTSLEM